MINLRYLLPTSALLPANPVPDVYDLTDCSRICYDNYLAGGGCRGWDWYYGYCELASGSLSMGLQYVNYTRPQVNVAYYGDLFYPLTTTDLQGFSYQITGGYKITGATQTGAATQVSSQLACQEKCRAANWGTGTAHTPPTVCGSWQYRTSTKMCTLFAVSSSTNIVPTSGGWVSGQIVNKTDAITSLKCPTGYKASSGGAVCPPFNDFGNARVSYLIQSSAITDNTGAAVGWKAMCTLPDVFQSVLTGTTLGSQIFYNPSLISATCCL
jgi:hypothetical protein